MLPGEHGIEDATCKPEDGLGVCGGGGEASEQQPARGQLGGIEDYFDESYFLKSKLGGRNPSRVGGK